METAPEADPKAAAPPAPGPGIEAKAGANTEEPATTAASS
jgi:hypothetical protein